MNSYKQEKSLLKNHSYYEICNEYNKNVFFDTKKEYGVHPQVIWNLASPNSDLHIRKLILVPQKEKVYWVRKQQVGYCTGEYKMKLNELLTDDNILLYGYEDHKQKVYSNDLESFTIFYLKKSDLKYDDPYIQAPNWKSHPEKAPFEAVDWNDAMAKYDILLPLN